MIELKTKITNEYLLCSQDGDKVERLEGAPSMPHPDASRMRSE